MPLFARFLQKIVDVLQNYVDKSGKLCYNDYGAQERAWVLNILKYLLKDLKKSRGG